MEVCRIVSRQTPLYFSPSSCATASCSSSSSELQNSRGSVLMGRWRKVGGEIGFYDQGHLQYYNSNTVAIMKPEKLGKISMDKGLKKLKKQKKQHLKLLKGLSRDLSTFSQIGFGLESDGALVDQVKGNMISEATQLLLQQLEKLRAEERELKKKRKEEKTRLKAIQMQNRPISCESSSSSSESSSDSECGEVINMNSLEQSQMNTSAQLPAIEGAITPIVPLSEPIVSETTQVPVLARNEQYANASSTCCSKKIEVCMGGKCKKSGAAELLDKFQRVVGIEGAVSGCKCMGKCRDGPNVKVMNEVDGGLKGDSVRSPSNPLCIGVSLEDVDMIVSNFLGEHQNQFEFAS